MWSFCSGQQNTIKVIVVVWSLSRVWLFTTPWTVACQAPSIFGISQVRIQGLLLKGIFSTQGLNLPLLPWQVNSLSLNHQGSQTDGTGNKKTCFCLGFLDNPIGKESACNAGNPGSIPGSLEDSLNKGKATHSSILAWRILSQRVGHYWATFTSTSLFVASLLFLSRLHLFCSLQSV